MKTMHHFKVALLAPPHAATALRSHPKDVQRRTPFLLLRVRASPLCSTNMSAKQRNNFHSDKRPVPNRQLLFSQ